MSDDNVAHNESPLGSTRVVYKETDRQTRVQKQIVDILLRELLDLQIYIIIETNEEWSNPRSKLVIMFYKNSACITWLQTTKGTEKFFYIDHIQPLLLMNSVSATPYNEPSIALLASWTIRS